MYNRRTHFSPLQLMQKFYQDYNHKQPKSNEEMPPCKYARKKSSNTDKMTRFLLEQDKKQRGHTAIWSRDRSNIDEGTQSPHRNKTLNSSDNMKRGYFKNAYSESHPFLTSSHQIRQKKLDEEKYLKTEPVMIISPPEDMHQLLSPKQNRKATQEIKDAMIRIKYLKKEKLDRVRYNYLVNNCFKNHSPAQGSLYGSKMRHSDLNTKQRIFPPSSAGPLKL